MSESKKAKTDDKVEDKKPAEAPKSASKTEDLIECRVISPNMRKPKVVGEKSGRYAVGEIVHLSLEALKARDGLVVAVADEAPMTDEQIGGTKRDESGKFVSSK